MIMTFHGLTVPFFVAFLCLTSIHDIHGFFSMTTRPTLLKRRLERTNYNNNNNNNNNNTNNRKHSIIHQSSILYMSDSDEYNEDSSTSSSSSSSSIFHKTKQKKSQNKNKKLQNEFSRPIHTDVILSPRSSRRQYNSQIAADEEELINLATRFSLSKISRLAADLTLTKDNARSASSSSSSRSVNNGACIQVKGDVLAKVTQTCVRTNEDFDVDLEFSIFSIVRASEIREVRQNNELGGMSLAQIEGQLGGGGNSGGGRKGGKKKRNGGGNGNIGRGSALNDMKMKEIESLLQEFDAEDDIFEDENVLGSDGVLDVGELVAQMFRLKLDPYPKKPGSEPVSYSISG